MRSMTVGNLAIFAVTLMALGAGFAAPAAAEGVKQRMSDVQQNALTDGCWARYNGSPGKLYPCLDGDAYWHDALIDGCKQRYSGNEGKLRRCVDTSALHGRPAGGPPGGSFGSSHGEDGHGMFGRALEYGCDMRYSDRPDHRQACLDGHQFSRRAHADGCMRLYGHDDSSYGHCLDSYRDGGLGGHAGTGYGSTSPRALSSLQRNALKDGCWQRYSGNNRKLEPCLRAQAYWQDALRDGCWQRYNGNSRKLERCLRY